MNLSLRSLHCRRCSHRWIPRKAEVRVCPRCHSPYWDRGRGNPTPSLPRAVSIALDEMVRRTIKACKPEKIILFGSHASGHAGLGSDVDLMVVTRHGKSKREQAIALYRLLWDVGISKDIVVVRPEEFDRYRDIVGTIIYPAAHQGKVLYERAA